MGMPQIATSTARRWSVRSASWAGVKGEFEFVA
jgi:hypothetical protein